jgi:hypothetical protein
LIENGGRRGGRVGEDVSAKGLEGKFLGYFDMVYEGEREVENWWYTYTEHPATFNMMKKLMFNF